LGQIYIPVHLYHLRKFPCGPSFPHYHLQYKSILVLELHIYMWTHLSYYLSESWHKRVYNKWVHIHFFMSGFFHIAGCFLD
jgi:hypothetical protein